jgi:hypothetical protein
MRMQGTVHATGVNQRRKFAPALNIRFVKNLFSYRSYVIDGWRSYAIEYAFCMSQLSHCVAQLPGAVYP